MSGRCDTIIAFAMCLLVSACASSTMGRQMDPAYLAQLQGGKTTMDDVLQHLGEPAGRGTDTEGHRILY